VLFRTSRFVKTCEFNFFNQKKQPGRVFGIKTLQTVKGGLGRDKAGL